jgi:hypothetical protein
MMQTTARQKRSAGAAADYRGPARAGYALVVLSVGVLGGFLALAPPDILAAADPVEVESGAVVARVEPGIEREALANPTDRASEIPASPRIEPIPEPASVPEANRTVDPEREQPAERSAEPDTRPKAELTPERAEVERPATTPDEEERPSQQARPTETRIRTADASSPIFTSRLRKQVVKAQQPRRVAKTAVAVFPSPRRLPASVVTIPIGASGCGGS